MSTLNRPRVPKVEKPATRSKSKVTDEQIAEAVAYVKTARIKTAAARKAAKNFLKEHTEATLDLIQEFTNSLGEIQEAHTDAEDRINQLNMRAKAAEQTITYLTARAEEAEQTNTNLEMRIATLEQRIIEIQIIGTTQIKVLLERLEKVESLAHKQGILRDGEQFPPAPNLRDIMKAFPHVPAIVSPTPSAPTDTAAKSRWQQIMDMFHVQYPAEQVTVTLTHEGAAPQELPIPPYNNPGNRRLC